MKRFASASILVVATLLSAVACDDGGTPSSAPPTAEATIGDDAAGTLTGENSPPPSAAGPPDSSGSPVTIRVNVGDRPSNGAERVQKWADDVAAGRIDVLTRKCWTISPKVVATEYSQVTAIKNILETPGSQTQFGMAWKSGAGQLHFAYNELKSDYPCPVADVAEGFEEKVPQAGWIVQRALRRAQGNPVNPADTEAVYPLTCLPQVNRNWETQMGHPVVASVAQTLGKVGSFDASGFTFFREGSELIRVTGTVDGRQRSFLVGRQQGGWCIPEIR
ncbi:MAG: hypothetical protein WAV90_01820 [Gordonia amarae]